MEKKKRSWLRRIVGWVVQLSLLLVLLLSFEAFLTRETRGMVAPPFEATTLSGGSFSLRQHQGEPLVVHFWATWCPVCELEQGAVNSLAGEVPMISVAMQSGSTAEVAAYLREQGVDYPVVNDEDGMLSSRYGVKAVPASFVLDRSGRIRFVTRGYTTGWGLRIRLWLAGLY